MDKRSQLGAHYTDRDKVMMIIRPVVIETLLAEWGKAKAHIAETLEKASGARGSAARTKAENEAVRLHARFLDRLKGFRVLDPASGSGNFLNLALLALKDIERRANLEAEAMGLPRGFPTVGPECVLGIELNPYAAELARVSVWTGEIQWMRRNGFEASQSDPSAARQYRVPKASSPLAWSVRGVRPAPSSPRCTRRAIKWEPCATGSKES